jgi:hypothetical protein
VYLVFIIVCIQTAKALFKVSLEFTHASSHEGVSTSQSFMFAVAGTPVTGTTPAAAGTGFGGEDELEKQSSGVALQQTQSRAAGAAGADTHYTMPKKFSSQHLGVDAASGGAETSPSGVTVTMPYAHSQSAVACEAKVVSDGLLCDDRGEGLTLWARSLSSPALLIALAAYLFAVTTICVASITEFAPPTEACKSTKK